MIDRFLKNAAKEEDGPGFAGIAEAWQVTRIVVTVADAADLAADPGTGGRIRGALGHRLADGASEPARKGEPCDWSEPCAFDLLFRCQGRLTGRLELPRPWALSVSALPGTDRLAVELPLFGIAGHWAGEIADALVRALRGRIGERSALQVLERRINVQEGVSLPPPGRPLMLDFLSPLMLRQGRGFHARPDALLKSAGNRISGLARWHGRRLVPDVEAFLADIERLNEGAVWEDLSRAKGWSSHSSRQQQAKPMAGFLGRLLLPPPTKETAALLALAETAQAGSHSTQGLGRFRLTALP